MNKKAEIANWATLLLLCAIGITIGFLSNSWLVPLFLLVWGRWYWLKLKTGQPAYEGKQADYYCSLAKDDRSSIDQTEFFVNSLYLAICALVMAFTFYGVHSSFGWDVVRWRVCRALYADTTYLFPAFPRKVWLQFPIRDSFYLFSVASCAWLGILRILSMKLMPVRWQAYASFVGMDSKKIRRFQAVALIAGVLALADFTSYVRLSDSGIFVGGPFALRSTFHSFQSVAKVDVTGKGLRLIFDDDSSVNIYPENASEKGSAFWYVESRMAQQKTGTRR